MAGVEREQAPALEVGVGRAGGGGGDEAGGVAALAWEIAEEAEHWG